MRVTIPAGTRAYQAGERTGVVVKQWESSYIPQGDTNINGAFGVRGPDGKPLTIVRVKLDKSGKTRPFILEDCTILE